MIKSFRQELPFGAQEYLSYWPLYALRGEAGLTTASGGSCGGAIGTRVATVLAMDEGNKSGSAGQPEEAGPESEHLNFAVAREEQSRPAEGGGQNRRRRQAYSQIWSEQGREVDSNKGDS